jgi:hypothetical protein
MGISKGGMVPGKPDNMKCLGLQEIASRQSRRNKDLQTDVYRFSDPNPAGKWAADDR